MTTIVYKFSFIPERDYLMLIFISESKKLFLVE